MLCYFEIISQWILLNQIFWDYFELSAQENDISLWNQIAEFVFQKKIYGGNLTTLTLQMV